MKSTGVTRKLDDVGRVVIPKNLRAALNLRDGEELEFYLDEKHKMLGLRSTQEANPMKELVDAIDTFMQKADASDRPEYKHVARELKKVFNDIFSKIEE